MPQVNRPLLRALEQNETTCLCVCFIPYMLQFSEAIFFHLARFAFVGRDDIRSLLQKQKIFGGKICTVFCHCEIALDVKILTIDFIRMFCSFNSIKLFHTDSCLFFSIFLRRSFSDMSLKICKILAPLYYFV